MGCPVSLSGGEGYLSSITLATRWYSNGVGHRLKPAMKPQTYLIWPSVRVHVIFLLGG